MYLAPYSEYEQLLIDKRASALSFSVYPVSQYSDLVQCVAVPKSANEAKNSMCAEFAASLLGSKVQAQLEEMKMLPVIKELEFTSPLDAYAVLGKQGMVPRGEVLRRNAQEITQEIARALSGDHRALGTLPLLFGME